MKSDNHESEHISTLKSDELAQMTPHLQVGTMSASVSLDHKDHSICTAVIGCTACALLIVEAEASDKPMYFILPSLTSSLSAPTLQKVAQPGLDKIQCQKDEILVNITREERAMQKSHSTLV